MRTLLTIGLLLVRSGLACQALFTGSPCTATVGTSSRNYSTVTACAGAIPVTLDANYVCSLYNDSTFTAFPNITGFTMGSYSITVTAAAGQSFQDQGSVRTNALKVDQTKGVAVIENVGYGSLFSVTPGAAIIISRIQFENTSTTSGGVVTYSGTAGSPNVIIHDCILMSNGAPPFNSAYNTNLYNSVVINMLATKSGVLCYWNCIVEGNTIMTPTTVGVSSGSGVSCLYSPNCTVTSNIIVGFSGSSTVNTAGDYNASDYASQLPGSHNTSLTYSASVPFANATTSSLDLRTTLATLTGKGAMVSGYGMDISGYTRASPPTPGAWELGATSTPRHRQVISGGGQ